MMHIMSNAPAQNFPHYRYTSKLKSAFNVFIKPRGYIFIASKLTDPYQPSASRHFQLNATFFLMVPR